MDVVFCHSSICLTAAEGSLWEKADGELMLRHEMMTKPLNCQETKKIRSTQRTRRPRNWSGTLKEAVAKKTCGSGQGREVKRPDAAQVRSLRVPPPADRTGARKQKRSFLLEGARDARAGWQQLGGGTEAVFSTITRNG